MIYGILSKQFIRVSEGEEKTKVAQSSLKEIMAKFPHLRRDLDIQVHEVHRSPNKINQNRPFPRPIIINLSEVKHKERILKRAREKKWVNYKGASIRLSVDFSAETLLASREEDDILKGLKEKEVPPRMLYLEKLSFRSGERKNFQSNTNTEGIITTRSALQEMLKRVLQQKSKDTDMKTYENIKTPVEVSLESNAEYSNTVIQWFVNPLILVKRFKDEHTETK